MKGDIGRLFPIVFPFLFAGMWLLVTAILAIKSGWYDLARKYPDRPEESILTLRRQSGRMSGVSMSGILRFESCPSGLRVGIWKIFGPFSRDFFVPWNEIRIERKDRFIWRIAKLTFGDGHENLSIMDYVANRLARSVPGRWPEAGTFPLESLSEAAWGTFKVWAAGVTFAASFFILAPRLIFPAGANYPPLIAAVGLPAFVFGIPAIAEFLRRIKS